MSYLLRQLFPYSEEIIYNNEKNDFGKLCYKQQNCLGFNLQLKIKGNQTNNIYKRFIQLAICFTSDWCFSLGDHRF